MGDVIVNLDFVYFYICSCWRQIYLTILMAPYNSLVNINKLKKNKSRPELTTRPMTLKMR